MTANPLENLEVLIVDDERLIQSLVYSILRKLSFRAITVAENGREAIELVRKKTFDFIITDWRMKDMDGLDLLNFVRKAPESPSPRLPVIFLTGNTDLHYVKRARDAGVNEYLLKPFSAEQLVRRIRSLIDRPRPFVEAAGFKGPERRHRKAPPPDGTDRRQKA